jgi:hypothetical protein
MDLIQTVVFGSDDYNLSTQTRLSSAGFFIVPIIRPIKKPHCLGEAW